MPSIGALPAVPSAAAGIPSVGADIGQAIGQAPMYAQQQQLQMAQGQDQMQTLAQKRLSQLAMMGTQKPDILNDPRYERAVEQVYKQMGMPVPRNKDGQIDTNAMLPPAPPDVKQKALGLPPGPARDALMQGFQMDENMRTAPMATSLNASMINAAQRSASQALALLGQGKISPQEYLAQIKGQQTTLGDSAAAYLDPTIISDTLGAATDANIAKIQELGIHLKNEDKYRSGYLSYLQDTLGEKKRVDTARMDQMAANVQLASGRLQVAQGQLQVAIQNAGNASTRTSLAVFSATTGPMLKEYENTEKLYNQVNGQISSAISAGSTATPALLQQQTDLKAQLDKMAPFAAQARGIIQNVPGNAAAAATGLHIVRDPASSREFSTSKSGKKIYSDDGGQTWHYQL